VAAASRWAQVAPSPLADELDAVRSELDTATE
jgi:hypothetical protein